MSFVHPKHAFMPYWIAVQYCIVVDCEWNLNVELYLGPMKKFPKREKMMSTRSNNHKCGYLLCYVAARVLHFSAFIFFNSELQENLIRSHAVCVGPPISPMRTRMLMALRINTLAKGFRYD